MEERGNYLIISHHPRIHFVHILTQYFSEYSALFIHIVNEYNLLTVFEDFGVRKRVEK